MRKCRIGTANFFTLLLLLYHTSVNAQGVKACESIYVDDCKEEADGAREQSFTSFYLDRSGKNKNKWTIQNLKQLIDFVEEEL